MTTEPQPQQFAEPLAYLEAVYAFRKAEDASFTLTQWASELGYRNPSHLSDVLRKRRRLTANVAERIAKAQRLVGREAAHFDLLRRLATAKDVGEESLIAERLRAGATTPRLHRVGSDEFQCLKDWYHTAVLEMTALRGFRPEPHWLARHLAFRVAPITVSRAVDRLYRTGLWRRGKGRVKINPDVGIGDGAPSSAIREHHKQYLELAEKALETQAVQERDLSGTFVAIRASDMPALKRLIEDFHQKVRALGRDGDADAVYRVSVQAFRVTTHVP